MRRLMLSLFLVVGSASADAPYVPPDVDWVHVCHDGEFRGLVVQAMKPGIYVLRFPADICAFGDA